MSKKTKFKYISLNKLKFNKKSPRLKDKDYNKILDTVNFLFQSNSILTLMLSIGENGYFDTEPLIVVKTKNNYKVIDGNLRLASLKVLSNPLKLKTYKNKLNQILEETSYRPNKIPCLIIDNEKDLNIQLGYKHISGFTSWDILEKLLYIKSFNKSLSSHNIEKNTRTIAKTVGTKALYIKKYIILSELINRIESSNEYSSSPIELNTSIIYRLLKTLSFQNINNFIGIELTNSPLKKLDYSNLEILIKTITSISIENNFFDKLNNSLENSYFASQFAKGVFFKNDLKLAKDNFNLLEKIENLKEYLSSLNTTDILNFTGKELSNLTEINEKISSILYLKLHIND